MKKLIVAALLISTAALAAAGSQLPSRFRWRMASCPTAAANMFDENFKAMCGAADVCSTGTCTTTAPTTDGTQGMSLQSIFSFRLTICAASGSLLTAAGTMDAYVYSTAEARWIPDSALNQSVTASTRCQAFPDLLVGVSYGRVQFVPNGVTVSGGATLDNMLDGQYSADPSIYGGF